MMTSPAPPIDYRNAVTATGTDPAMKDHGLAAGQALMRLRVLRIIEGYDVRAEAAGKKDVTKALRRILGEIDRLEIV